MNRGLIRRLLLKALYELELENGIGNLFLKSVIKKKMEEIAEKELNEKFEITYDMCTEAAKYLSDKGLIDWAPLRSSVPVGIVTFEARINAYGKDVIDDKNKLDKEIPLIVSEQQNINISGGFVGAITQKGEINIEKLIKNSPKELEELKKFISKKPKLLDWIKSLAEAISAFKIFLPN